MPIYEFKCASCGKEFEKLMNASDSKIPECIECGSRDVKKLFSLFGFSSSKKSHSDYSGSSSGSSCGTCTSSNCATCGR